MTAQKQQGGNLQRKGIRVGRRITRFFAGNAFFAVLLLIGLAVSGWMVWNRAIQPLLVEAGLPAGIPAEAPRLNVGAAQEIGQARGARVGQVLHNYARFSTTFGTAGPTTR